ncbi:MAG: hypothetical protein AB7I59_03730 [Geminicoccaceae bacterium]
MSWIKGTLQELANPGSEFAWATFVFAGNDPLEQALAPGYFATWGPRLREGDLILWGCNPDRTGKTQMGGPVAIRRALLMVVEAHPMRPVVRLVQDWGHPASGRS